jgi:pyridoxal phosphate enzyme (YggS family)
MVKDNIAKIKGRIPGHITIVAVSKNRAPEEIKEAVEAGITDIGENKVQEALLKFPELRTMGYSIRTHMVGHLQTNKAKEAVKIFDLIQSVDSLRLAQEIDKQAAKINKIQDILIEVKTSPEATKSGLKPDEAIEVIKQIAKLKNVKIKGLMTIAPVVDNPEKSRPYFRMLRELRDKINRLRTTPCELRILSMGMTDDFLVAIEEGADMVRLGRAIFE